MSELHKRAGWRQWWPSLVAVALVPTAVGVAWATLNEGPVTASGSASAAEARARPLTVLTRELVAATGYQVLRQFTGQVEAARSAAVGFELDGLVARVAVEEGERVAAGQLLATLDDARLRATRAERVAALAAAEARLALARITHRRIEGLVGRKHASAQELDQARENRHALRAELALAQARLDSIAVELDKTRLRAPFDAVVIRRRVDEGRVLSAGVPVLELQAIAAPEARVGITRRMAETLIPGQRYPVTINGRELFGVLRAVLPLHDGRTRSVEAILVLDVTSPALRSGDLVRLALARPVAAPGFWVPLDALTEGRRGTWSIYVLGGALVSTGEAGTRGDEGLQRIERRSVQLLHQQGDRAYVQGALEVGEALVEAGLHRVVPGQAVIASARAPRIAALASR